MHWAPSHANGTELPERPAAVISGDLNMLRCFVGSAIPTVIVATEPNEPTLRSRHCHRSLIVAQPSVDAAACVHELARLAADFEAPPVLYYGTDEMLLCVSKWRDALGRAYRFTMPDHSLVEALVDKARFRELARRTELPVPETVDSSEVASADELLERVPLPCAFKPSVHIGWLRKRAGRDGAPKKALRASTAAEARALFDELARYGPFVVQRWIPGGEDSIYSFHCWADEKSRIRGWFVGKKIRTYPKEAGVSTYLELVHDPRVMRLGFEIVERLGIVGPLKIDFKKSALDGSFYVLELNPRYTLWCHLGAVSGVNLPQIAYAHETGSPYEAPREYQTGVRWVSFGNDLRSFLRSYRPAGELTTLEWLRSYRGPKIYDIFSWRDPAPWLASALSFSKAASRRLVPQALSKLATEIAALTVAIPPRASRPMTSSSERAARPEPA